MYKKVQPLIIYPEINILMICIINFGEVCAVSKNLNFY